MVVYLSPTLRTMAGWLIIIACHRSVTLMDREVLLTMTVGRSLLFLGSHKLHRLLV